tara:strand:+ start:859 stop:1560 length:702 start_codon:yes stop_codon:yes gene_type:complete
MSVEHTRIIFERLCRDLPPLVPKKIQEDLSDALEQVQDNMSLTLDQLEDTMILFAKKLWPYREAFWEFYRVNEGELGEKMLLKKMPKNLVKKYRTFKEAGGGFRDLYRGGSVAKVFSSEDIGLLCDILVGMQQDIWNYTVQEVLTNSRLRYEKKIQEFKQIFLRIEGQLGGLLDMADNEQEHPSLAEEIRQHVRGFEYGIALLGPKIDYSELCGVEDYYKERKIYKKHIKHNV